MKNTFLFLVFVLSSTFSFAQSNTQPVKLYQPEANPDSQIKAAIAAAKKEHKNVLLQVGGNWCIWCTRFHHTVATNDTLSSLLQDNYVVAYINYEKKNDQDPIWKELGFPQRFGFPVFVILDEEGNRIHTQNSAYLEQDKGHSPEKIAGFFRDWTVSAVTGKK